MKRIHFFEFEDQPWFPRFLRNYLTDFLQHAANAFDAYDQLIPIVEKGLAASGGSRIIDLASGGGGGLLRLAERLRTRVSDLQITLTDYYPNVPAFERTAGLSDVFSFRSESVNALDVPEELTGLRTQFLSFHHFRPEEGQQILQNAVDRGAPILVVELQDRSLLSIFGVLLSPLTVLLMTPMIRPFRWGRLFFTYLLPLVPFFVCFDGVVSCLRTYSSREMKELIAGLEGAEEYRWQVGALRKGPAKVSYTLGLPAAENHSSTSS